MYVCITDKKKRCKNIRMIVMVGWLVGWSSMIINTFKEAKMRKQYYQLLLLRLLVADEDNTEFEGVAVVTLIPDEQLLLLLLLLFALLLLLLFGWVFVAVIWLALIDDGELTVFPPVVIWLHDNEFRLLLLLVTWFELTTLPIDVDPIGIGCICVWLCCCCCCCCWWWWWWWWLAIMALPLLADKFKFIGGWCCGTGAVVTQLLTVEIDNVRFSVPYILVAFFAMLLNISTESLWVDLSVCNHSRKPISSYDIEKKK